MNIMTKKGFFLSLLGVIALAFPTAAQSVGSGVFITPRTESGVFGTPRVGRDSYDQGYRDNLRSYKNYNTGYRDDNYGRYRYHNRYDNRPRLYLNNYYYNDGYDNPYYNDPYYYDRYRRSTYYNYIPPPSAEYYNNITNPSPYDRSSHFKRTPGFNPR